MADLSEENIAGLQAIADREAISRAEVIRRAVDNYLQIQKKNDFKQALDKVFGIWKDRNIDGLEYQQQIRAEWDERDAELEKAWAMKHNTSDDSPV